MNKLYNNYIRINSINQCKIPTKQKNSSRPQFFIIIFLSSSCKKSFDKVYSLNGTSPTTKTVIGIKYVQLFV